jgi:hypothetical protein
MKTILMTLPFVLLATTAHARPNLGVVVRHVCDQQLTAGDGSAICVNFDDSGHLANAYRKDDPAQSISIDWRDDGNGCVGYDVTYYDHAPAPYFSQHITQCSRNGVLGSLALDYVGTSGEYSLAVNGFNSTVPGAGLVAAAYTPAVGVPNPKQQWYGKYDLAKKTFSIDPVAGLQYLGAELKAASYWAVVFETLISTRGLTTKNRGALATIAVLTCGLGTNAAASVIVWSNVVTAAGTGLLLGACAASTYFAATDGIVSDPAPKEGTTNSDGDGPATGQGTGGSPTKHCVATPTKTCGNP